MFIFRQICKDNPFKGHYLGTRFKKEITMRKRFEQNLALGQTPISDVYIPENCKDAEVALLKALQKIFTTPEYNQKIFNILDKHISKGKKRTGRRGMDLWHIFILSQLRLCLNVDYDRLHYLANNDTLLRQIMGIPTGFGVTPKEFGYQTIYDNVNLLNDEMVKEFNEVIVQMGHKVFKKKETAPLHLKTDSFVVLSNVHFPTDYNLLWDSGRKCLDVMKFLIRKNQAIKGWRKLKDWTRRLKSQMRDLGKSCSGGGKNKQDRVLASAKIYIETARILSKKIKTQLETIPITDEEILGKLISLEYFHEMLNKHIELVDRRLIQGETIPHQEKLFSIFETYTQWITKGKTNPGVELGKNVMITTDQYHLIIDYRVLESETDSQAVISLGDSILLKYKLIHIWSFDKGFFSTLNKDLLGLFVPHLIMPKKGKLSGLEKEKESEKMFKKYRMKHSAVESNINELEDKGLDRCPDRGYMHFKRYVGLGVCAYNLHRIGKELIKQHKAEIQELREAA